MRRVLNKPGKILAIFTAAVLLTVSVVLTGCTKPAFSAPPATTLQQAPAEADALIIWQEFTSNEPAAMAKYQGKTLHFARVKVEKMPYLGEGMDLEFYLQTGQVKFRTDVVQEIAFVREGYTVEIVGKVEGMQYGFLIIKMSWLSIVDPPGGAGNVPPPEY